MRHDLKLKRHLCLVVSCLALISCAGPIAHVSSAPTAGSRYVAMGSSYAAGPGVTTPAETPSNRCQRSADNYSHQLARKRNLLLVDVSCGGATTAHLLGPWGEMPAQLDALNADTRLVTITIGGNDVSFVGGLFAASCKGLALHAVSNMPRFCPPVKAEPSASEALTRARSLAAPTEASWNTLESHLNQIIQEVHRRSPVARLIFVDYLSVIPEGQLCDTTPLSPEDAATSRAIAKRLKLLTAALAKRGGAEVLTASDMSRQHSACAKTPWITGFISPTGVTRFTPYHPNLDGMTAIASALNQKLSR